MPCAWISPTQTAQRPLRCPFCPRRFLDLPAVPGTAAGTADTTFRVSRRGGPVPNRLPCAKSNGRSRPFTWPYSRPRPNGTAARRRRSARVRSSRPSATTSPFRTNDEAAARTRRASPPAGEHLADHQSGSDPIPPRPHCPPTSLKGSNSSARDNAPGHGFRFQNEPCKGDTTGVSDQHVPPLQGLCVCDRRKPRALPGAVESQPFRLKGLSQGPPGTAYRPLDSRMRGCGAGAWQDGHKGRRRGIRIPPPSPRLRKANRIDGDSSYV